MDRRESFHEEQPLLSAAPAPDLLGLCDVSVKEPQSKEIPGQSPHSWAWLASRRDSQGSFSRARREGGPSRGGLSTAHTPTMAVLGWQTHGCCGIFSPFGYQKSSYSLSLNRQVCARVPTHYTDKLRIQESCSDGNV